ncbi:MAG: hypothetical protein R3Y43_07535 [Alphaproteobacteria bacterium]
MEIYKKTIKFSIWAMIILIAIMCIQQTCFKQTAVYSSFFNILVGIFTGFIITLSSAVVYYLHERDKYFKSVLVFTNGVLNKLYLCQNLMQRLSAIHETNVVDYDDEYMHQLLADTLSFSCLEKPAFWNYNPFFNKSPKKLNKYQSIIFDILYSNVDLTEIQNTAAKYNSLRISMQIVLKKIEGNKLEINKTISEESAIIAQENLQINLENYNYLKNAYSSCFGSLVTLLHNGYKEFSMNLSKLLFVYKFNVTEKNIISSIEAETQKTIMHMNNIKDQKRHV